MGVKIAVVGGGSTYTPELVEGLADRARPACPSTSSSSSTPTAIGWRSWADWPSASSTGRAGPAGWSLPPIGPSPSTARDFVVLQLRVGGQAARFTDETLPRGSAASARRRPGPGGFAKALRTVPVVLDLADEVARRAAPAPGSSTSRTRSGSSPGRSLDAGHRAIGLCNVAIGFQRRLAARFGVAPDRVELEHVGLNHLTWNRAIRVDGVDRLPELLADHADDDGRRGRLAGRAAPRLGALPSYYLRYYYADRARSSTEQLAGGDAGRGGHGHRARAARPVP